MQVKAEEAGVSGASGSLGLSSPTPGGRNQNVTGKGALNPKLQETEEK
jgi:hypothetical protein